MKPDKDLVERCREIIQWQDTGILKGTALKKLAKKMPDPTYSLKLAESKTKEEAMRFVIQAVGSKPTPDGALLKRVLETAEHCASIQMKPIADLLAECAAALSAQQPEPDEALIQRIAQEVYCAWSNGDLSFNKSIRWAIREYIRLSAQGGEQTAKSAAIKPCPACSAPMRVCSHCEGDGYEPWTDNDVTGPSLCHECNGIGGKYLQQPDTVSVPIVDLADPLRFLVELKHIKRRMEAGTATDSEAKFYEANKETAWLNAERALAAANEGKEKG